MQLGTVCVWDVPSVRLLHTLLSNRTGRFWDLIKTAENLLNFSVAYLHSGHALANFVVSIMRLGVGKKSILECVGLLFVRVYEGTVCGTYNHHHSDSVVPASLTRPIAKQAMFLLNLSDEKPVINANDMTIIGTAIVHLSSKAERGEPWVKALLHAAADMMLRELERSSEPCDLLVLMPLVRAFVIADEFHDALFTLLFHEVVAKNGLEHLPALSQNKLRNRKAKMYQIHVDCVLAGRADAFRLPATHAAEFKDVFEGDEAHAKNSSFRLQHLVSTALVEMGIGSHTRSFALAEGYSVDIALPNHKIAIEINGAGSYQVDESDESDENDSGATMGDKPFGFVDLKARHLEQLGWVVIQLRADKFQRLATVEDRAKHLSMLLEVANNAQRQRQRE